MLYLYCLCCSKYCTFSVGVGRILMTWKGKAMLLYIYYNDMYFYRTDVFSFEGVRGKPQGHIASPPPHSLSSHSVHIFTVKFNSNSRHCTLQGTLYPTPHLLETSNALLLQLLPVHESGNIPSPSSVTRLGMFIQASMTQFNCYNHSHS